MPDEPALRRLLERLDSTPQPEEGRWHGWQICRIRGGRNNLLYRVTAAGCDLACKFTMNDGRDRAGHEFMALTALRQAGLDVAPEPVLLDRTTFNQPVVVQTWLASETGSVPETDEDWQAMARHLASIHSVTPGNSGLNLPNCSIDARTAEQAKARLREQVALLPQPAQPEALRALVHRLDVVRFSDWDTAPVTLCRLDNNIANYVRRSGTWASVDWEYSGWGDPAFDVANLITHVEFRQVPHERWEWFVDRYCALLPDDETAPARIRTYCEILLVWWVARLARYLHDIPSGRDQRLAVWPEGWREDINAKYAHYVRRAERVGYPAT